MLQRAAVTASSRVLPRLTRLTLQQRCHLVTAAQKRALNKQQLSGEKKAAEPATAAASSPDTTSASSKSSSGTTSGAATKAAAPPTPTSPPAGGGGNGGSGLMVPMVVAGVVGAAGAAYYFDWIPMGESKKEEPVAAAVAKEVAAAVAKEVTPEPAMERKVEPEPEKPTEELIPAEESGNRVTTITFPEVDGENRLPQVVPPVSHVPGGHRVSAEDFAKLALVKGSSAEEATEVAVKEEPPVVTAERAAMEIRSALDESSSQTLKAAHGAIRANLNEALLQDLDQLSESELKVRVVQLAAEMSERTKWEAVRLKEFLAMKEKETADKYLEVLQKQRLEFEDLLARRLREQEDALTREANAVLKAKEDSIQALVTAATEAQEAEHKAELESTMERIDSECMAKYETEYGSKLANEKLKHVEGLKEQVSVIAELSEKLKQLESALQVSRTYESGSQRAHRISAASLALAGKLETSKGAAAELATLKAAAGDEGVIASALSSIPSAVASGVPTLSDLQAKFDKVHKKCREAAMVPEGRTGLDGQLFGMVFSKLTIPPSPDAVPVSDDASESSMADFILARARHHVQLGDLEQAVEQLDKLKGQAAFTVRDWKKNAMDRIRIEKALKVIKMECALMNENMSGGTSAAE